MGKIFVISLPMLRVRTFINTFPTVLPVVLRANFAAFLKSS